ncbi:hypothetical protein AArcS_2942 [Natranaeroarchaeum sulfidigenes]|uniref:Uncharacterized protein n=2 Tax=Natranaeroarchaeum sulfidigenes TaxID=2784880 RepID=A0A897MZ24_9EURY|nr:hypothetical protein AArcS_2942 [Natranaeroarchaeum sulfidigenes]
MANRLIYYAYPPLDTMSLDSETTAWISGFASGVATCSVGLYLLHRRAQRRSEPALVDDDGTVIPIE